MVLKNAGPTGAPGFPSGGCCRSRSACSSAGVRDMVRISDARMSGTAFGTVVLHVAPRRPRWARWRRSRTATRSSSTSSAAGSIWRSRTTRSPVASPRSRRRQPAYRRGYGALYLDHVLQADEGADFDFLRRSLDEATMAEPLGLLDGWIGGW